MSDSIKKDATFTLKAVINKQKDQVLFAVIDSDFADVLLSFLTLPLGKIVRVLEKHYGDEAPAFGSMTTLYRGLSNLDEAYFCGEGCKQMLLNPASSFIDLCGKLKLDIGDTRSTKYFCCGESYCSSSEKPITLMGNHSVRCNCGVRLETEIPLRDVSDHAAGEVFTQITSSFVLGDDLTILPNEAKSVAKIFRKHALIDIDGTECRNVSIGFNEVMDLLKWSLLSCTPLTSLILKKHLQVNLYYYDICKLIFTTIRFKIAKVETPADIALAVNAVFQKSSNKIIFVEAEEDFVEFLFSLLTIPLGKVEYLLGGNTSLVNIGNLYKSIASPVNSKYLRSLEITRLINPTVPQGYVSNFCIFPLYEGPQNLYYNRPYGQLHCQYEPCLSDFSSLINCSFKSPKGEGNYVKSPCKYMVKDDLTVTPACMASYISTIIEQKIPLSDVDELVLKIGFPEVSSILNTSLSSTCALTDALSHLLKKKPKLEDQETDENNMYF